MGQLKLATTLQANGAALEAIVQYGAATATPPAAINFDELPNFEISDHADVNDPAFDNESGQLELEYDRGQVALLNQAIMYAHGTEATAADGLIRALCEAGATMPALVDRLATDEAVIKEVCQRIFGDRAPREAVLEDGDREWLLSGIELQQVEFTNIEPGATDALVSHRQVISGPSGTVRLTQEPAIPTEEGGTPRDRDQQEIDCELRQLVEWFPNTGQRKMWANEIYLTLSSASLSSPLGHNQALVHDPRRVYGGSINTALECDLYPVKRGFPTEKSDFQLMNRSTCHD